MYKFGIDLKQFNNVMNIFKKYKSIELVKLFGSRANGTNRENSDIDLAIYGDISDDIYTKIYFEFEDLLISKKIDIVIYDRLDKNDLLKIEIDRGGVVIYERIAE